jgi:hypothetical protein
MSGSVRMARTSGDDVLGGAPHVGDLSPVVERAGVGVGAVRVDRVHDRPAGRAQCAIHACERTGLVGDRSAGGAPVVLEVVHAPYRARPVARGLPRRSRRAWSRRIRRRSACPATGRSRTPDPARGSAHRVRPCRGESAWGRRRAHRTVPHAAVTGTIVLARPRGLPPLDSAVGHRRGVVSHNDRDVASQDARRLGGDRLHGIGRLFRGCRREGCRGACSVDQQPRLRPGVRCRGARRVVAFVGSAPVPVGDLRSRRRLTGDHRDPTHDLRRSRTGQRCDVRVGAGRHRLVRTDRLGTAGEPVPPQADRTATRPSSPKRTATRPVHADPRFDRELLAPTIGWLARPSDTGPDDGGVRADSYRIPNRVERRLHVGHLRFCREKRNWPCCLRGSVTTIGRYWHGAPNPADHHGLSVINSNLLAGASVLLSDASVVEPAFWAAIREEAVTSLHGVPYTFRTARPRRFCR